MTKLILSFGLLLGAACSTLKEQNLKSENVSQPGWETLNLDFEQKLSDELISDVHRDFLSVSDISLQEFVAKIGNKLLSADVYSEPAPYRWNFTVVQSSDYEIFSLPAGEIFISTTLISKVSNEAELAGVIGHEIAHVLLKHTSRRMQEMRRNEQNIKAVSGGVMGVLGGGSNLGSKTPEVKGKAERWIFLKPTSDQESEADIPGISVAIKAGYDTHHVAGYFKKTIKTDKVRAALMDKFCSERNEEGLKGLVSSGGFERMKNKAKILKEKSKG